MFTWVCTQCGREVDVAESECPYCGQPEEKPEEAPTEKLPPVAPSSGKPAPPPPTQQPEQPRQPAAQPPALTVKTSHLVLFGVVLLAAIMAAVYFSRPDLLKFEEIPMAIQDAIPESFGRAAAGSIEVSGIRTWYDNESRPRVKALVTNHGEEAQPNVMLEVALRPSEAPRDSQPLATFEIRLSEPLEPLAYAEVETELHAAGTLSALPAWHRIRVDAAKK